MATTMKPAAAILVLIIMVLSAVGFAMNSSNVTQVDEEEQDIPGVIREPVSTEQQVYILRSGMVLIEHFYQENCTDCLEKNAQLESFVGRLEGYAVLNEVAGNESRLDMIGSGGKIVSMEGEELDYDSLIVKFCEVAIAQPRACILMDF